MASDLSGVFTEHTLVFQVGSGYVKDPETGNMVPGVSTPVEVKCWLKVTNNPTIASSIPSRESLPGRDQQVLPLRGRCVDPVNLPASIKAGMKAPLTLRGVEGEFTLAVRPPSLLAEVEASLGEQIAGVWRAS